MDITIAADPWVAAVAMVCCTILALRFASLLMRK